MLNLPEEILATLPAASRLKLERHASDREAARAAYRAASDLEQQARTEHGLAVATLQQRQSMPQGFTIGQRANESDEAATAARLAAPIKSAERALQTASAARERASERMNAYAFLSAIEDWLRQTARFNTTFQPAKIDTATLKVRGDHMAALEKNRAEIDALAKQFEDAENAPAPADDLKARTFAEIDQIAAEGAPTIYQTTRGGSPINLRRQLTVATRHTGSETNPVSIIGDGGAPFFVWLMKDTIKEKIGAMIDALPQAGALSDDEREAKFRDIASRRLELERQEESLVELLEAEGRVITRRADIDPRAYLAIIA